MKPFLLFAGSEYYPSGGWNDFQGDYASIEAALRALAKHSSTFDWYHIVDLQTGHIVEEGQRGK